MLEGGVPQGQAVLVHNGTPNSRLLYEPAVRLAERQGIRMISYDRPGYGGSDRDPGRSVASCVKDVRAIADALGIERLGVWGISGGGPHAIACAALLPDLVPAVAVLASIAPWGAEGLDYMEGMGRENVEDVELMLRDRPAARDKLEKDRAEELAATPETIYTTMETLLSPVDRDALTPTLTEFLYEASQLGLAPGADGWVGRRRGLRRALGIRARADPDSSPLAPRTSGSFCALHARRVAGSPHSRRRGAALRRGRPSHPDREPPRGRPRVAARAAAVSRPSSRLSRFHLPLLAPSAVHQQLYVR